MPKSIARIGLVIAAALALAPAALAGPVVSVKVGVPAVVIAPAPPPVVVTRPAVVVRPARPAPNYVWVEPHWKHDAWGRRVFVAGHWRANTVVVHRPAPGPGRVVVVKKY